jgi:hypothetical protein
MCRTSHDLQDLSAGSVLQIVADPADRPSAMEEMGAAGLHDRSSEPTVPALLGRYGLLEASSTWR